MRQDLYEPWTSTEEAWKPPSTQEITCNHCHKVNVIQPLQSSPSGPLQAPRIGNNYSQYVRKFSLGNGPTDWVREYLITKEGGKMLGTLVAVALARMPNLESFVWDMPTGILREIWQSLSKLRASPDGKRPGLEKISIRLHDNREVVDVGDPPPKVSAPPAGLVAGQPPPLFGSATQTPVKVAPTKLEWSYQKIEHPGFSICPPLKSLTVLNVDELAYLKELSILIKKSLNSMRELRLGMAHATGKISSSQRAFPDYKFTPEPFEESYFTQGSILGVLMSGFYDCRIKESTSRMAPTVKSSGSAPLQQQMTVDTAPTVDEVSAGSSDAVHQEVHNSIALKSDTSTDCRGVDDSEKTDRTENPEDTERRDNARHAGKTGHCQPPEQSTMTDFYDDSEMPSSLAEEWVEQTAPETLSIDVPCIETGSKALIWNKAESAAPELSPSEPVKTEDIIPEKQDSPMRTQVPLQSHTAAEEDTQPMLRLQTLALERMTIAELVLIKTIDMTTITRLTILECAEHERLWRILRRKFAPQSHAPSTVTPLTSPTSPDFTKRRRTSGNTTRSDLPRYQLNIKHLHTDAVSPAFISFVKETLRPNSLQDLFLQRRADFYDSTVAPATIYRGAIRPHRASLARLLVDSSELGPVSRTNIDRGWRKWQLDRDILVSITNPGKFPKLRELGFCSSYKDWVVFIQRLPHIPQLRSLYVPHIDDDERRHRLDGKDLAAMVVDLVISLRPEIELAMMGLIGKCFEVLESGTDDKDSDAVGNGEAVTGPGESPEPDVDPDELDDDDADAESDNETGNQPATTATTIDAPGTAAALDDADLSDSDLSDSGDFGSAKKGKGIDQPAFRLREILFYDKVAVFKARHGRL